jgi:hypothetical protein
MKNAHTALTFVAIFVASIAVGCQESQPIKVPSVADADSSGTDARNPDGDASALHSHADLEQPGKTTNDIEAGMKASEFEHRQRYPYPGGEIDVQLVTPLEPNSEKLAPGNPDERQ